MELLDIFITLGFWGALVRMATPLIFGTLGELICERAGVLNLGIEGIMTMGAMVAWMWVYQGGDLWTAVLVAAAFSIVTVSTMMAIVGLTTYGLLRLRLGFTERYIHAIAGGIIVLSGLSIKMMGL